MYTCRACGQDFDTNGRCIDCLGMHIIGVSFPTARYTSQRARQWLRERGYERYGRRRAFNSSDGGYICYIVGNPVAGFRYTSYMPNDGSGVLLMAGF